ncbi:hypothetical protein BpHYR1_001789 [Brachionus plicatilis]|uniref:CRIB domain-containing protein n=1 Tax=Brachionus plicatilis TaxID=10195 RepID=A0A3M7RLH6_BRAPC|nr:hypothetical protein BpHYR1_001789 [Brachionus plicatilis]
MPFWRQKSIIWLPRKLTRSRLLSALGAFFDGLADVTTLISLKILSLQSWFRPVKKFKIIYSKSHTNVYLNLNLECKQCEYGCVDQIFENWKRIQICIYLVLARMADPNEDMPPTPPVRNESTRHYATYSTNSSSLSTSVSTASTNTSSSFASSCQSNGYDLNSKPLPRAPDDDENKKKSKLKQTKESLSQSFQALSNTFFPRKLNISKPINFYHEVHVTFNPDTDLLKNMVSFHDIAISSPTNFQHKTHVQIDPLTGEFNVN